MIVDPIRPRLVLVTTPLTDADAEAGLRNALSGGDVASVILDPAGRDADAFQRFAEPLVPLIQAAGAAAIVADDTQCAGRLKADGIHLTAGDIPALGEAVARFSPKLIVGCSGFETRHDALDAGERLPDYLFFGRFGGDTDPQLHPKNLKMAEWWAEIVEIPCILMMGSSIESAEAASASGAEFVAAAAAVFADLSEAGAKVARANAIFDAWFEQAAA
ncbi:thiamine phosphate synthase [Aurantimonas sp. VKM B-3413]|uniref:thiamine phosphate synthase n=1 Tax=Aurantimonas sp. VKM B-3413 TaxID=2779401 RepID=UPI002107C65D|nr:thiamine phosphate synthase [Aurantimonas sp. VKM B-3413]MCB8839545.1 thiamine phosphate synthase [Aurantimonas sp. VKM B-3413]